MTSPFQFWVRFIPCYLHWLLTVIYVFLYYSTCSFSTFRSPVLSLNYLWSFRLWPLCLPHVLLIHLSDLCLHIPHIQYTGDVQHPVSSKGLIFPSLSVSAPTFNINSTNKAEAILKVKHPSIIISFLYAFGMIPHHILVSKFETGIWRVVNYSENRSGGHSQGQPRAVLQWLYV